MNQFYIGNKELGSLSKKKYKRKALIFYADLLHLTALEKLFLRMIFSYLTEEALHLSGKEQQLVLDFFAKINYELQQRTEMMPNEFRSLNLAKKKWRHLSSDGAIWQLWSRGEQIECKIAIMHKSLFN